MTTHRREMGIQWGVLQENAVPEELCDGGDSFTFRGSHYTESDDVIYRQSKYHCQCCQLLLSVLLFPCCQCTAVYLIFANFNLRGFSENEVFVSRTLKFVANDFINTIKIQRTLNSMDFICTIDIGRNCSSVNIKFHGSTTNPRKLGFLQRILMKPHLIARILFLWF